MAYFLFVTYLLLASWLIARMPFFRKTEIRWQYLVGYFWVKVAAGTAYSFFHLSLTRGGDTWRYHRYGLAETELFKKDPVGFFTSLFQSGYQNAYGNFFGVKNSWWNDLDANALPKLLGLCNLLSGSNYYVNLIWINFLFLVGPVLLYRVWRAAAPNIPTLPGYLPFLIPSFIFWTSGIHKEGFLFLALALVVHAFWFGFKQEQILKRCLQVVAGLLILLIMRNTLLLPFAAAVLTWQVAVRLRIHPALSYSSALVLMGVLFFGLRFFVPQLNLPKVVVERQAAFLRLPGNSKLQVAPLEPTAASFLRNAPTALTAGMFRPWPTDAQNLAGVAAAVEGILLMLLLAAALLFGTAAQGQNQFLWFCLMLSFLVFAIVGYTIPILGAVVRYRSIVLPFWTMGLLLALSGRFPQGQNVVKSG